jgi:uncharacterized membrane protein YqaE (UPF0057 family)
MKLTRILLCVVLPPAGVFLTYGLSATFAINILLTIFGWVPGIIHAVWALSKHEEKVREQKETAYVD